MLSGDEIADYFAVQLQKQARRAGVSVHLGKLGIPNFVGGLFLQLVCEVVSNLITT